MENDKVIALRKEFGLIDSRNVYTEEQVIELSTRKIYYIKPFMDSETGKVHIEYKHVFGYVSDDESKCIFIKDSVTGDKDCYLPIKKVLCCTEIKEGIYHNKYDDIIYCTTDELEFCLDYEKKYVLADIQEHIKEMEQELLKLKNADLFFDEVVLDENA